MGGIVGTVPHGRLIQNGSTHGGTVGTYLHVHMVHLDRMDGETVGTIPHSPTSTLRHLPMQSQSSLEFHKIS